MRRQAALAAWLAASLFVASPAAARAQRHEPPPTDSAVGGRALLEQQVRERFAQVVRQRLGLSAAQMRQLQETN